MPGEVDLIASPRDIDRSKRASALDTVIRHREVAPTLCQGPRQRGPDQSLAQR